MKFERGVNIKEKLDVGQQALAEYVHELYLYGQVIMPSGSRPAEQLLIKDSVWISKFFTAIAHEKSLEFIDQMCTGYMRRVHARNDRDERVFRTGEFKLCNPTVFTETKEENEYRIPKTLRHYKEGMYIQHGNWKWRIPANIDRYVRFASDDFGWSSVE